MDFEIGVNKTNSTKGYIFNELSLNATDIAEVERNLLIKNSKDPQWAFVCVVFIILLTLFAVQYSRLCRNCHRDEVVVDHKQVHYVYVKDLIKRQAKHLPLLRTVVLKNKVFGNRNIENTDKQINSSEIPVYSDSSDYSESEDLTSNQKRQGNKRGILSTLSQVFSSPSKKNKLTLNNDMIPLLEQDSEDELYDIQEYNRSDTKLNPPTDVYISNLPKDLSKSQQQVHSLYRLQRRDNLEHHNKSQGETSNTDDNVRVENENVTENLVNLSCL